MWLMGYPWLLIQAPLTANRLLIQLRGTYMLHAISTKILSIRCLLMSPFLKLLHSHYNLAVPIANTL